MARVQSGDRNGSRVPASKLFPMPELPEVETTRAGLAPHLLGRHVVSATLRRPDLRWPIAQEIRDLLPGQRIEAVRRKLERSTQGMGEIARACGFGSADVMGRSFMRQLKSTPAEYRARFRSSGIRAVAD